VETTVFIVRHGVTDWHAERKVLGQRDIPLNRDGLAQAHAVATALQHVGISDIVSSPLLRAVQTAEILAEKIGGAITRDPRLAAPRVGRWEGQRYDDVAALPDYQRFLADPLNEKLSPSGEALPQIRDRAVGGVDQALRDTPTGERLAVVTHAGIARVILAHYLRLDLAAYHTLALAPGSISVLAFRDDRDPPRLLTLGWRPTIKELV
jgi:broad specificity phosphatase PhoE